MDVSTFRDLLAPHGQTALAAAAALAPTERSFLADFRRMGKRFPADLARAALETAILQAKARATFSRADAMYFTREALEQATNEAVARHRSGRFVGYATIGDFCCGIGGDLVALATVSTAADAPGSPGEFLCDPDPAVTRAGLVTDLAEKLDARQLDPDLAFLTGNTLVETPFARAYRIEDALPFHARLLGELLRERGVGRITVLKRGSAVEPAALMWQLKLRGDEHRRVVLTRAAGKPYALVCSPSPILGEGAGG